MAGASLAERDPLKEIEPLVCGTCGVVVGSTISPHASGLALRLHNDTLANEVAISNRHVSTPVQFTGHDRYTRESEYHSKVAS